MWPHTPSASSLTCDVQHKEIDPKQVQPGPSGQTEVQGSGQGEGVGRRGWERCSRARGELSPDQRAGIHGHEVSEVYQLCPTRGI